MSTFSSNEHSAYYQIPTVTQHSQAFGQEDTVFSIYITYQHPIPDTKTLSKILSVSFGNHIVNKPRILEYSDSRPNSFSVTVRAPNPLLATQGNYVSKIPVNLIVAQQNTIPSQLSICDFSYRAQFASALPQAPLPPPPSHQVSDYTFGPPKEQHQDQTHSQQFQSFEVDPQVGSSENRTSSNLAVNPKSESSPVEDPNPSLIPIQGQHSSANLQGTEQTPILQQQQQQQPHQQLNQLQYTQPTSNFSGNSSSMSPVDTNYVQVSSNYHHQSSSGSYLDINYQRAPGSVSQQSGQQLQQQQQQTHLYYQQGSSYYQPLQGYDMNTPYDSSSAAESSGWGIGVSGNMGLQGNYYQPRVMGNQSQLGITDSRSLAAQQMSQPQLGIHPMMYGQFDPSSMTIPQLVRTTALSQATMSLGLGGMGHDPLINESTKATLEIVGNLEHMTQNWTEQETQAKRRLVQFKRTQRGSTVNVEFFPIEASKWNNNTSCISCIYWEEKKECFVTSVDCITLLEQLINNKFTVEEKNRIRRNLEGYHPMTVSKAKASSSEFFKVIMAFDKPKPRNIEKDVKVFQWALLGKALQKIVGKYSADYSGHAVTLGYGSGSSYHSTHQIIPLPPTLLTQKPTQVSLQPQSHIPNFQQHNQTAAATSALVGSIPSSSSPVQYGQPDQDAPQSHLTGPDLSQSEYKVTQGPSYNQWSKLATNSSGFQQYPPASR